MNKILKKIAKKILLILPISQVDWAIRKILWFYEIIQIQKELNMFDKKQKIPLNFQHYLPNTEERIERLRKLINKRPVAIILPGSSVRELEERIREIKDCDICYAGMNDFLAVEKYILQKINRNLSVISRGATPGIRINEIAGFLERPENNIFISEKASFQRLGKKILKGFEPAKFIEKYDKKLLFLISVDTSFILTIWGELFPQIPSREYPLHFIPQNSLSILLSLMLIGGASKIIIFGGDGGRINSREVFFRESDDENRHFSSEHRIMVDTEVFNATMPLILKKIYKTYNLETVDIINCSEQSHYTSFRKLSYDETFDLLKYGKSIKK